MTCCPQLRGDFHSLQLPAASYCVGCYPPLEVLLQAAWSSLSADGRRENAAPCWCTCFSKLGILAGIPETSPDGLRTNSALGPAPL